MSNLSSELHRPVMLERCLELLKPGIQGNSPVVVDATLGLGGHTEALLNSFCCTADVYREGELKDYFPKQ